MINVDQVVNDPAKPIARKSCQRSVVANVAPIVFDPNIRPAVLSNRDEYMKKVEKWVAISSAVKVSDEDLNWLYPGKEIDEIVNDSELITNDFILIEDFAKMIMNRI